MKSVIYSVISTKIKSFYLGEKFIKKKNDRRDVKQNVLRGVKNSILGTSSSWSRKQFHRFRETLKFITLSRNLCGWVYTLEWLEGDSSKQVELTKTLSVQLCFTEKKGKQLNGLEEAQTHQTDWKSTTQTFIFGRSMYCAVVF